MRRGIQQKPTKVSLLLIFFLIALLAYSISLVSLNETFRHESTSDKHMSLYLRPESASSMKDMTQMMMRINAEVPINEHGVEDHHQFAIFYNAFISKKRPDLGIAIIQEQMQQVSKSGHKTTPVYYNIIGVNYTEPICPKDMNCTKLRYLDQGNEVDTLQDLYNFCQSHTTHYVLYLHDKGSLHPSASNHKVRKMATSMALSDDCRTMTTTECTVCSSVYQFLPHGHTPGNHWIASCDYVRTLIPPHTFESKRRNMYVDLIQHPEILEKDFPCFQPLLQGFDLETTKYSGNKHQLLGIGRYAMETWIWSSPLVQPCHVMDSSFGRFDSGTEPIEMKLRQGPGNLRFTFSGDHKLEWFHVRGKLYEYNYLYPQQQQLVNGTNFLVQKFQSMSSGPTAVC